MLSVKNSLRAARTAKGLSQEEVARRVGISRRAYVAIESGASVPATDTALRLASALGLAVEALFSLEQDATALVEAELAGGEARGAAVRLARVGTRLLAQPLAGHAGTQHLLAPADGIVSELDPAGRRAWVQVIDSTDLGTPTLVLAGCDPAIGLVADALRQHGVKLVASEMGSFEALGALARGEAHVAGCHMRDPDTGDYNRPWVRRVVPFPCTLVRFAEWREAIIVGAGNPRGIDGVEALAHPMVRIVNRQQGSGSRALLDRLLAALGISPTQVNGYEAVVRGHLALAQAVAAGFADAGIGVEAAARAFGLGTVPIQEEPYDLVIPDHFLDLPQVQALLSALRRRELQRKLSALGGYDTVGMGLPAA